MPLNRSLLRPVSYPLVALVSSAIRISDFRSSSQNHNHRISGQPRSTGAPCSGSGGVARIMMPNFQQGGCQNVKGFGGRQNVDAPQDPFVRKGTANRPNPWEGAVIPGAGNFGDVNRPSGGGLLPTPNMLPVGGGLLPNPSFQGIQLAVTSYVLNQMQPLLSMNNMSTNYNTDPTASALQMNVSQQVRNTTEDKGNGRFGTTDKTKNSDIDNLRASYARVPCTSFFCHICSKKIWNVDVFVTHLKSKEHKGASSNLEDRYKIEIEKMRHDVKMSEQRQMRPGKYPAREYCAMCNLHVHALLHHRSNPLHQKLKSFVHPKCDDCSKEFASRIDWDQHRLSAQHLLILSKKSKLEPAENGFKQPKSCHSKTSKTETVLNVMKEVQKSCDKSSFVVQNLKRGSDVLLSPKCNKNAEQKDDPVKLATKVDIDKIPKYDACKEIGMEMLEEKTGYLCKCCTRFLNNIADGKAHCKSQFHYERYVTYIKSRENKAKRMNSSELVSNEKSQKNESDQNSSKPSLNIVKEQNVSSEPKSPGTGNHSKSPFKSLTNNVSPYSQSSASQLPSTMGETSSQSPSQVIPVTIVQEEKKSKGEEAITKMETEEDEEDEEEDESNWKRRKVSDEIDSPVLPEVSKNEGNVSIGNGIHKSNCFVLMKIEEESI